MVLQERGYPAVDDRPAVFRYKDDMISQKVYAVRIPDVLHGDLS